MILQIIYMCSRERITKQTGQLHIVMCMCDQHQQIYSVAVNISWIPQNGTTPSWIALPRELHWLCRITDG